MAISLDSDAALLLIDVQEGFDDPRWGRRNNPGAEANIGRLAEEWRARGRPVVRVRHASANSRSPLAPGSPGHAYKPVVAGLDPDLEVVKSVHSAFLGDPDLDEWLRGRDIGQLVVSGIQTNMCCETTARFAGDLGYDVVFAIDATHTFDSTGPDGSTVTADQHAAVTAANLEGNFARVAFTADLVGG